MKANIVGLIAFMMLGGLASTANNTNLMQLGMGRLWLAIQGVDVQNTLDFVLGALVVVILVAYMVFTGKAGIWLMSNSTTMGDPRERSQAQNAMLHILYALMGVLYSSKERIKLNGFKLVDKLSKILVVLFLSISTAFADANDTVPLKPNLATGWAGLPPDVQKWVMWIISVAFVFFVAVAIIYTFGGSIKSIISGKRGDVAGRSSGISEAFTGVAVLIIAVIAVLLIIFIASNL